MKEIKDIMQFILEFLILKYKKVEFAQNEHLKYCY